VPRYDRERRAARTPAQRCPGLPRQDEQAEEEVTVGVLQRFEARIERLINGAFAKAFKSEVEPVEIASALQRSCDERAVIVSRDRTMVPNAFVVELSRRDHDRLLEYSAALRDELAAMVRDHGAEQHYTFLGPVTVTFEPVDGFETGVFRVIGATEAAATPTRRGSRESSDSAGGPPTEAMSAPGGGYPQRRRPTGLGWLEVASSRYDITAPVTVLGRGSDVDLRIDDPGISRRHAEIRVFAGSEARVLDLGSTNGLVVDGRPTQDAALREGTTIRIGSTDVVFHVGDHAPGGSDARQGSGERRR
jgi:pSer/pThr/pTyr-binding forkhead associated (FHA) protein